MGRSVSVLNPPERSDEIPQVLYRLSRGQRIEPYETMHLTKDGRHIQIELTVSPIKDRTGKSIGASAVCRDITAPAIMQVALVRWGDGITNWLVSSQSPWAKLSQVRALQTRYFWLRIV